MCDVFGPPVHGHAFQRHQVYKSRSTTFVFGIDKVSQEYSVLRIRVTEDGELDLQDGEERFPMGRGGSLLEQRLRELEQREGELKLQATASGIMGFIRFLQGPYLVLVTKRTQVGKIGHHRVMSIETTKLEPLFPETITSKYSGEERAFCNQFGALNLSKDFYFSYTYDMSRTVQQNLADAMAAGRDTKLRPPTSETRSLKHHRFVWNHYHMRPLLANERWQHWCLSIVHGFFKSAKCSTQGWTFEVALIARRSRFYAGTRYRKRGVNADGQVANDVETEQLVCDNATRHLSRGHVTSFVQMRGSVPIFWSQEVTAINPKPPIVYQRCDPTLSATRLHFGDLLERYGTPQVVVNLMKARLSTNYESAIECINRELPSNLRILYRNFDMKNHSCMSSLYEVSARLSESVTSRVGFFHTHSGLSAPVERMQSGVVRANCMDCLDRTNVLQFFVGLEALKRQLAALGLLPESRLEQGSQLVSVLIELYDLMGDHLALQYAGSKVHKKYQLLGSRPRMMPSSKELVVSMHRHYSNSFTDEQKQASINLFLGVHQPQNHPSLSVLDCDSFIHHAPLRLDFHNGEWWELPLQVFEDTARALRSLPLGAALPTDERRWFGIVHKCWKFTDWEKRLADQESTSVQILAPTDASGRQLSENRHYRMVSQQRGAGGGLSTLLAVAASEARQEATLPAAALPPAPADSEAEYRAYLNQKALGWHIWLPREYSTAERVDLGLVLPLPELQDQVVGDPGARDLQDAARLLERTLQRLLSPKPPAGVAPAVIYTESELRSVRQRYQELSERRGTEDGAPQRLGAKRSRFTSEPGGARQSTRAPATRFVSEGNLPTAIQDAALAPGIYRFPMPASPTRPERLSEDGAPAVQQRAATPLSRNSSFPPPVARTPFAASSAPARGAMRSRGASGSASSSSPPARPRGRATTWLTDGSPPTPSRGSMFVSSSWAGHSLAFELAEAERPEEDAAVHLRLCAYCGAAFSASADARGAGSPLPPSPDEGSEEAGPSSSQRLCERHRQRAAQLDALLRDGSFTADQQQAHASPRVAERRWPITICVPRRAVGQEKPWHGWLRPHAPQPPPPQAIASSTELPVPPSGPKHVLRWYPFPHDDPPAEPEVADLGLPEWWLSEQPTRAARPVAAEEGGGLPSCLASPVAASSGPLEGRPSRAGASSRSMGRAYTERLNRRTNTDRRQPFMGRSNTDMEDRESSRMGSSAPSTRSLAVQQDVSRSIFAKGLVSQVLLGEEASASLLHLSERHARMRPAMRHQRMRSSAF